MAMDDREKEIGRVLVGLVGYDAEGSLVAMDGLRSAYIQGLNSGSGTVQLWGVRKKTGQFSFSGNATALRDTVVSVFRDVGRGVHLATAPDALCVLIRPLVGNPVVMTAELHETEFLLTAYTARSFFSARWLRRYWKQVTERFPEGLQSVETTLSAQLVPRETPYFLDRVKASAAARVKELVQRWKKKKAQAKTEQPKEGRKEKKSVRRRREKEAKK